MDNAGERGALVLLDEAPIADVLAEIAAVGKDRGAQRAHVPGVDPRLAWPLPVDPRSFSTSMSRSASRIERLRVSSQRCRSTRLSADVLEPPGGDGGGDLLHGVQAEIAAVGKDRGAQRAHVPGVDPRLAWPLPVDAAPEVVLDLDEQVGEPDRATAGVQPAVQVDQAVRVRRGGVLGRVRLQLPPVVVEHDLPGVRNTLEEPVECIRQTCVQVLDRRGGIAGESGARPKRVADRLPLRARQEERLEAADVLRAVDGEVARLDLVVHREEQRALPAAPVGLAVVVDERLQRRRGEVQRCVGRHAAASRRAVCAGEPPRRQRG